MRCLSIDWGYIGIVGGMYFRASRSVDERRSYFSIIRGATGEASGVQELLLEEADLISC